MSRNKDIEFLHTVTGDPYSVCRARMKACKWNLIDALQLTDHLDILSNSLNSLRPVFADVCESLGNMFCSLADSLRE